MSYEEWNAEPLIETEQDASLIRLFGALVVASRRSTPRTARSLFDALHRPSIWRRAAVTLWCNGDRSLPWQWELERGPFLLRMFTDLELEVTLILGNVRRDVGHACPHQRRVWTDPGPWWADLAALADELPALYRAADMEELESIAEARRTEAEKGALAKLQAVEAYARLRAADAAR